MAEFETKQPEEEKQPFFKTPLGIILIVVAVLLVLCCVIFVVLPIFGLALLGDNVEGVFQEVEKALNEAATATAEANQ